MNKTITLIIFILLQQIAGNSQQAQEYYFRAVAQQQKANIQQAIAEINKALKLDNNNVDYLLKAGELNMANSRYSSAIAAYRKAEKIKPNSASLQLAQCYSLSQNTDSAIFFLEKYLKFYNKIPQWQIKNNPNFENIKNTEQWTKLWQKNNYSKPDKLLQEAQYEYKYGNLTEALIQTNKIIKKYKKFDKAYFLKAEILSAGKNNKEAVKFYSKAIELNPHKAIYYKKRANSYFLINKHSKAATDIDNYLKLNQLDILSYKFAATIFDKNKQYDKALEYITTYTKYFSDDYDAIFLQAQINFDAGNFLETIRLTNLLFDKTDEKPQYYHLRARAYLNANSYQLAYNDFSMCLDLNPSMTDSYYYRGIANLKMQNIDNACADWYSAIEHKDYRANDYYYEYCKEFEKKLKQNGK